MQEARNPFVIAKCESFCSCIYFFVIMHKRVYISPHGLRSIGVAEWAKAVGDGGCINGRIQSLLSAELPTQFNI